MKRYNQNSIEKDAILQEPTVSYGTGSFYQLSIQNISKNYIKQVLTLTRLTVSELITIIPISIDTYKKKMLSILQSQKKS